MLVGLNNVKSVKSQSLFPREWGKKYRLEYAVRRDVISDSCSVIPPHLDLVTSTISKLYATISSSSSPSFLPQWVLSSHLNGCSGSFSIMVDLQCCVTFKCTTKWFIYMCVCVTHAHILLRFLFHIHFYRILTTVPWATASHRRHYFANTGASSQSYFSSSHVWMWESDYKGSWVPKN